MPRTKEKQQEYNKRNYQRHREKRLEYARKYRAGILPFEKSKYNKEYYLEHQQNLVEYQKEYRVKHKALLTKKKQEYRFKIKHEVILAYGGKCTCCGETEEKFLTIEHLQGRKNEIKRKTGYKMFAFIKSQGFPKDEYTILCFNCNCAKGAFGICPHQEKVL